MLLIVLLMLYIASQQPEAPSSADGYDEHIHGQVAVALLTMIAAVAALFCVWSTHAVTPIRGTHMQDPLATKYPR